MRSRGFALIEALAAIGVAAIGVGSLVLALGAFSRIGAHAADPRRVAAAMLAEQTLRTAADVWKYGSPGAFPAGSAQVTLPIPVPSGSPAMVPATLTTAVVPSGDSADVSVTVAYTPGPGRADPGIVRVNGKLVPKAPLPGSQLVRPGFVPSPASP